MTTQEALQDEIWRNHRIGNIYQMSSVGGFPEPGWKIAYYPLVGTYKGNKWVEFDEPRALVEKQIVGGTDFREVPLRYLTRFNVC